MIYNNMLVKPTTATRELSNLLQKLLSCSFDRLIRTKVQKRSNGSDVIQIADNFHKSFSGEEGNADVQIGIRWRLPNKVLVINSKVEPVYLSCFSPISTDP